MSKNTWIITITIVPTDKKCIVNADLDGLIAGMLLQHFLNWRVAYNQFIGNRKQLIEDCKEMIQILDNTSELEAKLASLNQKAEDIIILVKNLIDQNSTEALDQDDFQKKYDLYDLEHKRVVNEIETVGLEIEKKAPA